MFGGSATHTRMPMHTRIYHFVPAMSNMTVLIKYFKNKLSLLKMEGTDVKETIFSKYSFSV